MWEKSLLPSCTTRKKVHPIFCVPLFRYSFEPITYSVNIYHRPTLHQVLYLPQGYKHYTYPHGVYQRRD